MKYSKILILFFFLPYSTYIYSETKIKKLSYEKAFPQYSKINMPALNTINDWLNKIETRNDKNRKPSSTISPILDNISTCKLNTAPEYKRKNWIKRWKVKPGDCQDVRQKVLERENIKNRKLNYNDDTTCKIKTGFWQDQFSEKEIIKNASKAQVTHTVSLRNVHNSGGYKWPIEVRTLYVNNIKDREHLIVVSGKENRKRAGKSPAEYLPKNLSYRCEYIGAWVNIKRDWNLCMTIEEKEAIISLEQKCIEDYNRDYWEHWTDEDQDCLSTRNEVLIRDSKVETEVVRHYSRDGQKKKCKAHVGQWYDPFTYSDSETLNPGELDKPFTLHTDLDVDHIVPLMNAHKSGGWAWPKWKKQEYANYMKDPNHLLAVSSSENRSKGAKGPEAYLPPSKKFQCSYVKIWTKIKKNWSLTMTKEEKLKIKEVLKQCRNKPI